MVDEEQPEIRDQVQQYWDDISGRQLDPQALFYLAARGLPPAQAKRLLTEAFARELVDKLPSEALQAELGALIAQRLGAA